MKKEVWHQLGSVQMICKRCQIKCFWPGVKDKHGSVHLEKQTCPPVGEVGGGDETIGAVVDWSCERGSSAVCAQVSKGREV